MRFLIFPGKSQLYQLQLGAQMTPAFPIGSEVIANSWQPTLDFYAGANGSYADKEAYRTWHGLSHMDDALQAPANYNHFDLYAHNGQLDTQYKPF